MACEPLDHCERHALRLIRDRLLFGPVRGRDASTEVIQGLIGSVDVELTDLHSGFDVVGHDDLLLVPINAVSCVPPHTGRSKGPVPCAATVAQTVTSSPSSIEHLPIPGMPTC